ncbi:MAG: TRCF domain-containing protein, partial [Planctomycetota bacterium]
ELLADAVRKLKGEPVEAIPTASLDLGFTTYIPKNYIPTDRHRMDAYRKIAIAKQKEDLKQIESELADVYGPLPEQVNLLLELAELRIAASKKQIRSIVASGPDLVFKFSKEADKSLDSLFAKTAGKARATDPKTVYFKSYFEPKTLINFLRKILGGVPNSRYKRR